MSTIKRFFKRLFSRTPSDPYEVGFQAMVRGLSDPALDDGVTASEKMMAPFVTKEVPNPVGCGGCANCQGKCSGK